MQLYIVRHGIAIDREDPKCPSTGTLLTEEGVEKTRQVAKGVAALGATADLLLSSPYVRAMQTAELFAREFDYAKQKIRRTDLLLRERSLRSVRELSGRSKRLYFSVWHAPQLDDIIATDWLKRHISSLKRQASP